MPGVEWLSDEEERAWRALQEMQLRLEGQLNRDLAAHSELSIQDYAVLIFLTDVPDGRLRLYEIAAGLGWEQSRTSKHIARMQSRGLVRKERCSVDRRGWHVAITAEGRTAIEEAAPSHVAAVRRLFIDHLTPAELEQMARIGEKILAVLETQAG